MRRQLMFAMLLVFWTGAANARSLLLPEAKEVPPLAMVNHKVDIGIEDQVAVTKVEQTFKNPTDRQLEAVYVFPVPKGASISKFSMQVDGKDVKAEMVQGAKARELCTQAIRRSQDPGLLAYLDNNLIRVRVPVASKAELKIALSYTSLTTREGDLIEYVYPLRATQTKAGFSLNATVKGQHAVRNVYSPTHSLTVKRTSDREVAVAFDKSQDVVDKDLRLFFSQGDSDIGLTAITHRPDKDENGHFLLLITPKVELAKENQIARDMILVLDTSGSMNGVKIQQAKKALKFCLSNLGPKDRFGMLQFSTRVGKYKDALTDNTNEEVAKAKTWVDQLRATGGTNINEALLTALAMRSNDPARTFTVVFFTDGMPTASEKNPEKIVKNVMEKNSANTRIFSFGVGNDVNATFLDRLSEQTRAVSTYVRPNEDIEEKVSNLYSKISNPVLANLKLSTSAGVTLEEIYPPHLPDLFEGGQLVVLGRYRGKGAAEVKLTGNVGKDTKEFVYKVSFPDKTNQDKEFVEQLWAGRKVGYLLDQIRANGEKKELVDEVTALSKKYGIATPYTSYLVVAGNLPTGGGAGSAGYAAPEALAAKAPGAAPQKVTDFAKEVQNKPGELSVNRGNFEDKKMEAPAPAGAGEADIKARSEAKGKKQAYDQAHSALKRKDARGVQAGKLGVDLSLQTNNLRNQCRLEQSPLRRVANRNCLEIGGVWIDESYAAEMQTTTVKAMSDAYFRILEKHPEVKELFGLGNHLVWVTPSGTALVIDTNDGKEKLTDEEIDKLFVAKK